MTDVLIPVPQSSIGTVESDPVSGKPTGRIIMAREWYRYFSLIQKAIGGTTDIIFEVSDQVPPFEQLIGETLSLVTSALVDAAGQISQAQSIIEDLQRRVRSLEAQAAGREEFPYRRVSDLEMLMPGPAT